MKKALATIAACVLLAACTKSSEVATSSGQVSGASGGPHNSYTIAHTLRVGDIQDITSLNPHLATAASLGFMSQLTMAYLARYDIDNRPVPELATVVPTQANGGVSKDGLTITWHLRHGVKW